MSRSRLIALGLTLAIAPAAARADPPSPRAALADARARLAALDYEDALHILDAAWRRGGSDAELAGAIAELAARAAASLDQTMAARSWYRAWLCIDPKAALPIGTSPALQAVFDAARGELGDHWLRGEARRRGDTTAVTIVDDPCHQAAAVRDRDQRAAVHAGSATLWGSPAPAVEIVDAYGNALATVAVAVVEPQATWYGRPATWAVTSGVAAGIAAIALGVAIDARQQLRSLAATSAASSMFYDGQPAALQQRFDRANAAGTVLVGGALVAAGIAVVLWLRQPARPVAPPTSSMAGWSVAF